jgi:ubiquitin carboxyl-terminal hydrolase 4/11
MDAQGEPDVLQVTLLPAPHQHNPPHPSPDPEDVPSSSFLRFQAVDMMRGMPLIEGATWVLVSKSWYRRFEKAATGQVDKEGGVKEDSLGPVDNSSLLEADGKLNEDLVEGDHFECFPEAVWVWLTNLYVLLHQ